MSCNHPMKAFWTGNLTENGKKEYVIIQHSDVKYLPEHYALRKGYKINWSIAPHCSGEGQRYLKDPVTIPCGKCVACRLAKSKEWTTRICLESKCFKYTYFLTLTYDDYHLPPGEELSRKDLRNFIKRLRKYITFRYFACGEYGALEKTNRPHYHIIIMTDEKLDLRPAPKPNSFYNRYLDRTWTFGLYELSFANETTIAYTAGYVFKKQLDLDKDNHIQKPFISSSDKPGFGYQYLLNHEESILRTKKVYVNGKAKNVFRFIWKKLAEKMDIEPIKDELMIQAKNNEDKLKWYFNEKYIDNFGNALDELYTDFLKSQRKEKM